MKTFLAYGPAGLFAALMFEYFGLPVPGETFLLFEGTIEKTAAQFALALLAGVSGSALGSSVAFWIGHKVPKGILQRLAGKIGIARAEWDKAEQKLSSIGVPLLLFSRYVIGVRHIVPYLLGLERMPRGKFTIFNLLSAILWCGPLLSLGRLFGAEWPLLAARLHTGGLILIAAVIVLSVAIWWRRRHSQAGPP